MILFLDVVSPFPKFLLIDNNIVKSIHILNKNITKISDVLIAKYLMFEKKNKFINKLNEFIVTTGPGSFTSLRVGISFMYGQSISQKIPIFGISIIKILNSLINTNDFHKTMLLICSSNNQNFICVPCNQEKQDYQIHKITDDLLLKKIDLDHFTNCISNHEISHNLIKKFPNVKKLEIQNIEEILKFDILSNLKEEKVIKPIYL